MPPETADSVDLGFVKESGRTVASWYRPLGDIDAAERAVPLGVAAFGDRHRFLELPVRWMTLGRFGLLVRQKALIMGRWKRSSNPSC
jgi:hypothetical protein